MEYIKDGMIYLRDVDHCEVSPYIKMVTIKRIVPALNSDNLDHISFEEIGWETISQKGLHYVGEKVLFIPAESVLPFELSEKIEVTKYLSSGRVKVARFRDNRSEGIIVDPETVEPYLNYIMKWEDKPTACMNGESIKAYRINPYFHKFHNMPNILNEPYTFRPGEKIYYSEKIHGCLANKSIITMADGSKKYITKVKPGEYVTGFKDGRICDSKVLKTFDNGRGDKWLRISGKRKCSGKGANIFSVCCTPNHRFWNPILNDYISADMLKRGDMVTLLRTTLGLTPIQEQILLGKLLGDGYLQNSKWSASIEWSHKKQHEDYIDWTLNLLGDISSDHKGYFISGFGTEMCRTRTLSLPCIKEYFQNFYRRDRKVIPEEVIDKLTPISLAFLYMDQGSLTHDENQADRASFAICNFNKDDCEIFIRALAKFNIKGVYYTTGNNHSRIRINSDDAERLFLIIYPYIPMCMQYKLPERFRCPNPFIPVKESIYRHRLINIKIENIEEDRKIKSRKYDLETETHNFFTNDILVHNSNMRCGKFEDPETGEYTEYVGSHHMVLEESDRNIYWKMYREKLEAIPEDIEFFAEVYGIGIQDLNYGLKDVDVKIFAATRKGYYMTPNTLDILCKQYNLPVVDFKFTKFKSVDQIRKLANEPSEYTEKHMREGIVVVSADRAERMAKCKSDAYEDRRNKKERH